MIENVTDFSKTYRIGDALLLRNSAQWKLRDHPNTIGHDYVKQLDHVWGNKIKNHDYLLLKKIVDEHVKKHGYSIPEENELVIHYRFYPNKLIEFEKLSSLIDEIGIEKVTIVCAFHFKKAVSNIDDQMKEFEKILNKYNAKVKSSKIPDEDFSYLVNAKYLITTYGNFSELSYRTCLSINKKRYNKKRNNE